MSYNKYRHHNFNLSKTQAKEYAQNMDIIRSWFNSHSNWIISQHLDSCYKNTKKFTIRLSNHSPNNQYHDLYNSKKLIINITLKKSEFIKFIETNLQKYIDQLLKEDLTAYRFININPKSKKITYYLKDYKTKKIEKELNY